MRHFFTGFISAMLLLLVFSFTGRLQAQPFPWCPNSGDIFAINAANYTNPGCNMDGVNYGMGSTGVTCTNVQIDVAGIAAAGGFNLNNCNMPMLNFTVFQGCGAMSLSNTNYYDPNNYLGGGACAEYVATNGAISVPITPTTTVVDFVVCTTSNNQSIGPVTITGCCTASVTTCPSGATLTCAQAEAFASNPSGLFAFLGGVVTVNPVGCGTVSLSDNFNPGLPCGGTYSVSFTGTFTPNMGTPQALDVTNCAAVSVTVQPAPQATAVNPPGNTSISCSAAPPSASQLTFSNGLTGACAISGSVMSTITGSHNACGGSYTETWTFTDACNRTSTASRTITVQPAPLAAFTSLPGSMTIACSAAPPAPTQLSYSNGQTGPCTISGVVTSTITGTHNECGGSYTESWSFTDACGRTINHSRTITVQPAPIANFTSFPGNITIACATGTPASNPLSYSNGQGGACSISGSVNSTFTIQNDACPRRYTETWTFTDRCGRLITHSRTVTVNIFWQNSNIGAANGAASYSCTQLTPGNFGPFQVSSVGYGTPTSDIMHFAYARLSGDGTIIAKFNNATNQGFGGIMFRETLAPGSKKAALRTQNSLNNFQREVRQTTNGVEVTQQWPRLHNWLRMDKIGDVIAAYTSPDGINWWSCPSHTAVALGSCFYVGVFAEGINVNSLSTATFDVIRITGFNQQPVTPFVMAEEELLAMDQTVDMGTSNSNGIGNAGVTTTAATAGNLELTVYPNPVTNGEAIAIELKGAGDENVHISVYSLQGVMVKAFWANAAEGTRIPLELPNIPAGGYLVKAQTSDRRVVTSKFTVNRN